VGRLYGCTLDARWHCARLCRHLAPEVAGQIVEFPVTDNQFVHKGDLLTVIDPRDYTIAVSRAEAAVKQAEANARNAELQSQRRQKLTQLAVTIEDQQTYATTAVATQAQYQQALANLDQARVNLERTQVRSPVNGFVTHLLAQLGDYANVGQNIISVVDADSFWVDGYFEEIKIECMKSGCLAQEAFKIQIPNPGLFCLRKVYPRPYPELALEAGCKRECERSPGFIRNKVGGVFLCIVEKLIQGAALTQFDVLMGTEFAQIRANNPPEESIQIALEFPRQMIPRHRQISRPTHWNIPCLSA